jgi:Skp family chaperone for outer membrane proteins
MKVTQAVPQQVCNEKENVAENLMAAKKDLADLEKEIQKQGGDVFGYQDEQKLALLDEIKQWQRYLKNGVKWI